MTHPLILYGYPVDCCGGYHSCGIMGFAVRASHKKNKNSGSNSTTPNIPPRQYFQLKPEARNTPINPTSSSIATPKDGWNKIKKAFCGAKDNSPQKAFFIVIFLFVFDSEMRNFPQGQGRIRF